MTKKYFSLIFIPIVLLFSQQLEAYADTFNLLDAYPANGQTVKVLDLINNPIYLKFNHPVDRSSDEVIRLYDRSDMQVCQWTVCGWIEYAENDTKLIWHPQNPINLAAPGKYFEIQIGNPDTQTLLRDTSGKEFPLTYRDFRVIANTAADQPISSSSISGKPISPQTLQSIHSLKDVHEVWKLCGIRSNLFRGRVSFIKVDRFDTDSYSILQISDDLDWDWQYIILVNTPAGWKFAGNIDLGMQKSGRPKFQFLDLDTKEKWFSLEFLKVSGTGWIQFERCIYTVEGKELRELLRYPSGGANAQSAMQPVLIDFTGEIIDEKKINILTAKVEVQYLIAFASGYLLEFPESKLFTAKRTVLYLWDPREKKFRVQSSQVIKELEDNFSNFKPDDLLKEYYQELTEMTSEGDKFKEKWLRRLLSECKDNNLKRTLVNRIN